MDTGTRSEGRIRQQIRLLSDVADDLAGELRPTPLLERILRSAVDLLACESGSICLVDEPAGTYRKEVDLGVGCQSGQVFPLTEGVTGAVVRAGGTVGFRRYSDVPHGHVHPADERYGRGVIGVPIRLRGSVLGAFVVFGERDDRVFTDEDAELLELFATHAAVAIANSRLHAEATDHARAVATAAERERSTRDVHDVVGRSIASVLLHLDGARRGDPHESIAAARKAAAAALVETERAVHDLIPLQLERSTPEEAIRVELDWIAGSTAVATQLLIAGERRPLPAPVSAQLFRIAQEALSNAVRHAEPSRVRVGMVYGDEDVSVVIEDDGCGFDVHAVPAGRSRGHALGLRGMTARAVQAGGTVQIDSTVGWGTRVHARLPYAVAAGGTTTRWRVVVVHDRPVVRAGLVQLLTETEPAIRVLAESGDVAHAGEIVTLLRPDVVIVGAPSGEGAGAVALLRGVDQRLGIVLMVDAATDDEVRAAAEAGASGFVEQSIDGVSLARMVASAANGDIVVPRDLLRSFTAASPRETAGHLTAREREVCALVGEGLPDKQIATRLGISAKTVEKHVSTILRKTGTRNRTMLAVQAARLVSG